MSRQRLISKLFGLSLCFLLLISPVSGTEEIVELRLQKVKALTGLVTYPNGDPVKEARVVEFSADWKNELRATVTDSQGRFTFTPVKGREIYYLQISASETGVNPLRVPLQISRFWGKKSLELRLNMA
jgi:hypothetical protein